MSTNTIGHRIQKIISVYYSNMSSFAKDLNISISMVSKICAGKANPSDRTIADICRICNINEEWLRYGTGEMEDYVAKKNEISKFFYSQMDVTSEIASQLVSIIVDMPPSSYPAFNDALARLVEEFQNNPNATYEQLIQKAYEDGFQFGFKMAQKMRNTQDSEE